MAKDLAPKQNPDFSRPRPNTFSSTSNVILKPTPVAKAEKTPAEKGAATKARNKRKEAKAEKAVETAGTTTTVVGTTSKPTPDEVAADQGTTLPRPPEVAERERRAAETVTTITTNSLSGQAPADPAANTVGITAPGTTLGVKAPNPGIKDPGSTLDS